MSRSPLSVTCESKSLRSGHTRGRSLEADEPADQGVVSRVGGIAFFAREK